MNMFEQDDLEINEIDRHMTDLVRTLAKKYPNRIVHVDMIISLMITARKERMSQRHLELVVSDGLKLSDALASKIEPCNF